MAIKKISWWHESIVDWMLENPDKTQGECAKHFDVTEGWLSQIKNSDAFREYFSIRREEHNSNVSKTVIEKVEELAELSVDVLHERIEKERESIGLGGVLNTADMALKALGFGNKAGAAGNGPTVQINVVNSDQLAEARAKMRQLNGPETPALPAA